MISFPRPRYEVRRSVSAPEDHGVFDTDRAEYVFGCEATTLRAATLAAAALNREYQRWLTERFYEREENAPAS